MPPGDEPPHGGEGGPLTFVVHEHHARRLHWDLRLERDGVLASWAVPKGLPDDPRHNHLAVHVEDHPYEYGSFEGTIPAGEYGAGRVTIWDRGTYEASLWTDREVKFHLHGARVDARFVLFQTDGDNWMVHREDPPPSGWTPLPTLVRPMLATAGELPVGAGWAYEFKWDGVRTIAYVEGGGVRLRTRGDRDATATFPELRGLGEALGSRAAVLDGEVIALGEDGRPSFEALQPRLQVAAPERARRLAARAPVTYMLFDVLHLDGQPVMDRPYEERRRLLEGLDLAGDRWLVPPAHPGPGGPVLQAARANGLEGVVAKRLGSPYVPGRRSRDWVKTKLVRTQEVVVGGWTRGSGTRQDRIGALLVGIPDGRGGLRYAGKVGTGFDEAMLRTLQGLLEERRRPDPPFTTGLTAADRAGASWAAPDVVGEVRFTEWTKAGKLRQPSWRGLRPDKEPGEVVREP